MAMVKGNPATEAKSILDQAHAFFHQGNYAEAAPLYRQCLSSRANDFIVWGNLGISLRYLNYYEAAAACLKRSFELCPTSAEVLRHYAHCMTLLNRKDEALTSFEKSLKMKPGDFNTHAFYGFALREFGLNEKALEQYTIAHKMDPGHVDTSWALGDVFLRLGRFSEGWVGFQSRWKLGKDYTTYKTTEREKTYQSQRWKGEDLTGKTILVYEEQGYGDVILCSRYVPMLKGHGAARVIFRCSPELHRLFQTLPGVDRFISNDNSGEKIDYHIPIMDLPAAFGTEVNTIPPPAALHVPSALPNGVAPLLAFGKDRFKVGIVWSGRPTFKSNYKRAVSLARFLPLAEVPGVQLYSLQKGPGEAELADCGAAGIIPALGPHLKDFADTAAVLKQLDLVIMTDSAVAHLAGSIGCPVWNMLSYCAYWVYLLGRDDSPWYRSMRLFRQPEPGDWDSVFARVKDELQKAAENKKETSKKRTGGF